MNRKGKTILVVFLLLVAASSLFLGQLSSAGQMLGKPGLQLAQMELYNEVGEVVRTNGVALPIKVIDCTSKQTPVTQAELDWLPDDTTYGRRRYTFSDGTWIENSVVLMGQDRTSIHKPEYCLPGQGFTIDTREVVTVPITQPHSYDLPDMKLTTSKTALDRNGREVPLRGVYIYWFVADGKLATHHLDRMWMMTQGLLSDGVLQRWAYVTYFAICSPGDEEATFEKMAKFIAESVPQFQTTVGKPAD